MLGPILAVCRTVVQLVLGVVVAGIIVGALFLGAAVISVILGLIGVFLIGCLIFEIIADMANDSSKKP